jgi:hypothetical protein
MDFTSKFPGSLVVRRVAPFRNLLVLGVCGIAGALALYIIYELGRYDGGYDRLAASQQRVELEVQIEKLEAANRELRTQLAELDTLRIGRAQERAELGHTIGDLQSQVARQSQELAFYRNVVSQRIGSGPDSANGVLVEQLHITPGDHPGAFRVRLVLLGSAHPETATSGTYVLSLDGQAGGKPETLDFAALAGSQAHAQPFNFRYFANLEQDIAIPAAFRPQRITVQLQSSRKSDAPVTQSFPWSVDAP